jgi:predicted transcriptional regulator
MVGNISNYTKHDILRCFFSIRTNESRQNIVKNLELGEGTVRTILNFLKNKNLIISTKKGHSLTYRGLSLLSKIRTNIDIKDIKLDEYKQLKKSAILLKTNTKKKEYELRDIAIKNGAEGAFVFKYNGKRLIMPKSNDYNLDLKHLEDNFNFSKDDLLVVSFAKEKRWAEISNLAIAMEVSSEFNNLINKLNN